MNENFPEYVLRPLNQRLRESITVGDPYKAFALFVQPGLSNPSWVEESRPNTDTGMSMREWAGLIIHCLALSDLTGETLYTAKDYRNGDGAIARKMDRPFPHYEGLFVEQTLVTHLVNTDVLEGIAKAVAAKSAKGGEYAKNIHLIVWCNIVGQFETHDVENIVNGGAFKTVGIIGMDDSRDFHDIIIDKDRGCVHNFCISEQALIERAGPHLLV